MGQEIAIGDHVTVRKSVNVPLAFKGTVVKLYANSALLSIDSYHDDDKSEVEDLKGKTVVNFKHIRKSGKTVTAPKVDTPPAKSNAKKPGKVITVKPAAKPDAKAKPAKADPKK